jgi:hypothetical protein
MTSLNLRIKLPVGHRKRDNEMCTKKLKMREKQNYKQKETTSNAKDLAANHKIHHEKRNSYRVIH